MATYSLETQLPSYYVNRAFLKDAERFIQEQAKTVLKEAYEPKDYRIKIQDKFGTQTLNSVNEFQYSEFPNDTQAVQLEYRSGLLTHITLELRLHNEGMFSKLEISLSGESPRQHALGIKAELDRILDPYASKRYLLHPHPIIGGALYAFGSIGMMAIPAIFIKSSKLGFSLLVPVVAVILYLVAGRFFPYTTFETKLNQSRQAVVKWLLLGVLGFVLFSVLGVYYRKQLLDF